MMIEQPMRAVVLGHLKVLEHLIAQVRDGVENAVPITPDGVVIHQANTLEVLQGVSRSLWACRDILEHEQEQPAPEGLPPMDAAWWQEYNALYHEVFAIHHRLINLDIPLFEPEEVLHLGEFMGMTSRIQAVYGQGNEPL